MHSSIQAHQRLTHMHTALGVQVVGGDVLVKDGFALSAPPSGGKLVPHGSVHCIVEHVQARECDEAARAPRQRLRKLEPRRNARCTVIWHY